MFENLTVQPEDQILKLTGMFRADPRTDKIDLGVGVYRNAAGQTPVMRAIKKAEQQLWNSETTKAYTALAGDPAFHQAITDLLLGDAADPSRLAAVASVGGTGALRIAMELVRLANPQATVWVPSPTWPNHLPIARHVGLKLAEYRYFDSETGGVDFGAMMQDLGRVAPGDIVLLHGCCHNPTGANLTLPEWDSVAEIVTRQAAIPLIDIAYQGFGDGLQADAAGTRLIASRCPEALIASSCSKNFGIYRERTGLLLAVTPNTAMRDIAQGNMATLNRVNFSFPPDHGARLVTMVLTDPALRAEWTAELEEVRLSMLSLRESLADALRARTGSDRFGFLAQHRGMFSRLGATSEQVETLREKHGVYMVGDSRINIAGLNASSVPVLADAIAATGI